MIDEELINKVKQKDMTSFRQLYDQCREKVYFTAYSILKDKGLAEDVLQEVFIKVYSRIGDLKAACKFEAWVCRITLNAAKDIYSKKRDVLFSPVCGGSEGFPEIADNSEDSLPEEVILNRETSRELTRYIYELPEYQRIPLILFYYNNLSIEDIAFIMECSSGTIKSRLFHGKKALKQKLIQGSVRNRERCILKEGEVKLYENR